MAEKSNTEDFKKKVFEKHGDIFDLSKVSYINSISKVILGCKIHGDFLIIPNKILNGRGCPKCGIIRKSEVRKMSLEEFIRRAKKLHGMSYNYDKVVYVNALVDVTINCNDHGDFQQTPAMHLWGQGCPKCGRILGGLKTRKTFEKFIQMSKERHGDKFDYSKVKYEGHEKKVILICKLHGEFEQTPASHLRSPCGCPQCANDIKGQTLKYTTETFIQRAKEVHGDKYDYSRVVYIHGKDPIEISCKRFGHWFKQKPHAHLCGYGCPKCNSSKGEDRIREYLEELDLVFIEQKTFDGCKFINKLHFDFYLPNANLCIEFDGVQHFPDELSEHSKQIFGRTMKDVQVCDETKNKWCKENNVNLLRIKYDQDVVEVLDKYFRENGQGR